MIFIGKSPYRVSLLGGSSDLDWFVKKENVKCKNMNWKWNALYTAVDKNKMNESHFIHFFLRDKLPAKGENIEELLKKLI